MRDLQADNRRQKQDAATRAAQERQRIEIEYTTGELKKIAELADVEWNTVAKTIAEIDPARLWVDGTEAIKAMKATPKPQPKPDRRAEEDTEGRYTERRSGAAVSGGMKVDRVRDAYANGEIDSGQYAAQMKALGKEP